MEDLDLERRFHLMQKEIETTASLMRDQKIDLTASVDALKIELEVLKTYIARNHPDFLVAYPKLREEAIRAIDPEWLGSVTERKQ